MTQPTCPPCQKPMEPGFLIDNTYGGSNTGRWSAGTPDGYWFGEVGRDQVERGVKITAYRCPSCFRVELFANPTSPAKR